MTAILNQIAEKWYGWELAMLWQVGILIAIVAVIELLTRRWVWPQVRYALWFLILVKLVLPPSLVSPMSFTAEIPFMVKQVLTDPEHKIQNTELRIQNTVSSGQILNSKSELSKTEIQNKPQAVEVTRISAAPAAVLLSWKSYIFFVWMAGVAILSGWLVARLRSLRREHLQDQSKLPERLEDLLVSTAHKLGLKRVPQIILTNKVCCPAVFGVFRPVLLMPADKLGDLTREDAEHIFLHELAHIKRGDLPVKKKHWLRWQRYWYSKKSFNHLWRSSRVTLVRTACFRRMD